MSETIAARVEALTEREAKDWLYALLKGETDGPGLPMRVAGEPLTPQQAACLMILWNARPRVVERSALAEALWTTTRDGGPAGNDVLQTVIGRLRLILRGAAPEVTIHAARGLGFWIEAPRGLQLFEDAHA